jgi:hypothetical protein
MVSQLHSTAIPRKTDQEKLKRTLITNPSILDRTKVNDGYSIAL